LGARTARAKVGFSKFGGQLDKKKPGTNGPRWKKSKKSLDFLLAQK